MKQLGRKILCALLALVGAGGVARGQAANEARRFNRTLQQIQRDTLLQVNPQIPLDQRMTLDYGAYLSFSYTSLDDNNNANHGLRQSELYAFTRLNIDGAHEFFLRYHTGYRDFNSGDSFTGRGSEPIDGEIDRGYYRFDLQKFEAAYHGKQIENNLIVQGGRDFVYWANGLVLANTLDGGIFHGKAGPINLDLVGGVTPVRTVDFDPTRPDFDFNTHRGFYGAMFTADVGTHHPYVYAMLQRDYNKKETLTTGVVTTKFDYNSLYLGFGSTGNVTDHWLYGVEITHEGGNGLSNSFSAQSPQSPVVQTHDDIDAWAADLRLDYLVNDLRRTRVTGELIVATGEDDRLNTTNTFGGNAPNTVDHAFNAFGALNTGLAFAPNVSNIISARLGASTFPLPGAGSLGRLQLGTDFFLFHKFDDDAPIDENTNGGVGYLGWEPDVFMNWQVTSDVTFAARYGIFFPNSDAFGTSQSRQFLYFGVTYAF